MASFLLRISASRVLCMESITLWLFLLICSISSSFSASFRVPLVFQQINYEFVHSLSRLTNLFSQVGSQSVGSLHVDHEVLHLGVQPLLGLLQRSTLGVHSLDGFLGILKALGELFPVASKEAYLLGALDSVRLVSGSPLSHLAVGLGHPPLQLRLGLHLLLVLLSEQITVVPGGLHSMGQGVLGLFKTTRRHIYCPTYTVQVYRRLTVLRLQPGPLGATDSMLLERSSISILYSLFSFSSFCLTRCRLSICSPISATLSACFLRRAAEVASCCRVDSSRSRRSFWNSASRFLFISIWTDVAPPASSSRSLISSSSLERSALCFSTLARAALSASISSSSSSIRA
ncbi:hypothetical protein EYF80_046016 [Liparis tanakae]|uniref:Uncharacterized protein n=1 Tax=Liparis tanakae TaxID=230148 RepID=A0A4Z2FRM8_9TELE|nr:hypothetical protein EYF80_046016 [Liparis tanakae]